MRILITGSEGFIGRQTLAKLDKIGEVLPCSRKTCDLLDAAAVSKMIRQLAPTHCLHLAWYTQEDYAHSKINLQWLAAGMHLIREFYAMGGKRFIGVGTCFEYAPTSTPCSEEKTKTLPETLYGKCKLALGSFLKSFAPDEKASWAWCRPFFIMGPGESQRRLIPSACCSLLKRENFYTAAYYRMLDYMDVRDVVDALISVLTSDYQGRVNVAVGEERSVGDILAVLAELVRNGSRAFPHANCDNRLPIIGDTTVLRQVIKFKPQYSLRDTLYACLDDSRRNINEPC